MLFTIQLPQILGPKVSQSIRTIVTESLTEIVSVSTVRVTEQIGRFQTLLRESVKYSNSEKLF